MGKTYRQRKTGWDDDYQPIRKTKKKFTRRKDKHQDEVSYEERPKNGVHNRKRSFT